MPPPADYHMHTRLCRHAEGDATDYAAQAVRLGLPEIGFSDHSPMERDDFDDWRMRYDELDAYIEQVQQARRDHPTLPIKIGLEIDYIPGYENWIRELAARHPWDYFIGSVHYVTEGWDIDNPKKISEWKKREPLDVWTVYLERLAMAAASGLFEIIGHVDLPKKFCIYPHDRWAGLFERFLETAKAHGVTIELNTAGLRKDCKEIYPHEQILKMAAGMGVPITFGSDAHAPSEVGMDLDAAVRLARAVGYCHCCRFTQRRRDVVRF